MISSRFRARWTTVAVGVLAAGALAAGACSGSPEEADDSIPVTDPAAAAPEVAPIPVTDPAAAAPEAAPGEISISLAAPRSVAAARDAVNITVTMTNVTGHPVRVLRYRTPLDGIKEDLFRVARDGAAVAYLGRHYKWAAPQPEDFITLDGGQGVTATVDLAAAYDLAETGSYTVAMAAARDLVISAASPVTVQVEGRPFQVPGGLGASLATTGCSSSRISAIDAAYASARTMARAANSYLSTTPGSTARYATWFGAYSSSRWSTVRSHFSAISQRLSNEVADCSCTDNAYAYVFPTQHYKIYLCNAFWSAPNSGADSRAGTLIHEMSHFDVVAGTDDLAYGQTACRRLAQTDPARALKNADSHEYFAENVPFQY